jgi:hypothetical protein
MITSRDNAFKIIDLIQQSASNLPLESRVKQHYTPRLFSKTLINPRCYEGIATRIIRKWLKIDKVESKWPLLFQEALDHISEEEIDRKGLDFNAKQEILRLKQNHWNVDSRKVKEYHIGIDHCAKILREDEGLRPKPEKLHWTQDRQEIEKRSLLRKVSKTPHAEINEEIFTTFYNPTKSSNVNLHSLFKYLKSFLATFGPMPAKAQHLLVSTQRGLTIESELEETIELGKAKPLEKNLAKSKLQTLSKKASEKIRTLEQGDSITLFGGIPARKPKLNLASFPNPFEHEICSHVKTFLSQKEESAKLATSIITYLKSLKETHFNEIVIDDKVFKTFKEHIRAQLIDILIPSLQESCWKADQSLWQKIKVAPKEFGRTCLRTIANYTQDSIVSSIVDAIPKTFLEELEVILKQEDLKQTTELIEGKLHLIFKSLLEQSHEKIVDSIGNFTGQLPPTIKALFKFAGYGDLGEADSNQVWFEVTRSSQNTYDLCVYTTGEGLKLHPYIESKDGKKYQIPLIYKGLTEADLDSEFVLRLLSYQAYSAWDGVSYTIQDLYQGPLASFKPAENAVSQDQFVLPEAVTSGKWGLFKEFIKNHLGLSEETKEKKFHFNLRKQALLDMWTHIAAKPNLLDSNSFLRNNLQEASEKLIAEAVKLYDEKILHIEELKDIYATTWEVIDLTKRKKEISEDKPASVLIPPEIKIMLHNLIGNSSEGTLYFEMIKDTLIGILGDTVEPVFDEIVKEMALSESEKLRLNKKATQSIWNSFKENAEQTYQRMKSPISWSVLKIDRKELYETLTSPLKLYQTASSVYRDYNYLCQTAIRISEVAFSIYVGRHSTTGLAILVAQYTFRQAFTWCFPEATRSLIRLRQRIIGQAIAKLILNQEQMDSLNRLINEWESYLLRNGTIHYDLPEGIKSQKEVSLRWHTPEVTLNVPPIAKKITNAFALDPNLLDITSENFNEGLQEIINKLHIPNVEKAKHIYLHEQIKKLPPPTSPGIEDCWSTVKNYRECLESVATLTLNLAKAIEIAKEKRYSLEFVNEMYINLFKLYAITDKLARRCPESDLTKYKANPLFLAFWTKNPVNRVLDISYQDQLNQVCHYFEIDPKHTYSDREIEQLSKDALFYNSKLDITANFSGSKVETRYYKEQLKNPIVQERLKAKGINLEKAAMVDLLTELYLDEKVSFNDLKKSGYETTSYSELFDVKHNPRCSLLSRPFHLLRIANYLIQNTTDGYNRNKIETINELPFKIKNEDPILKKLHAIPLIGRLFPIRIQYPGELNNDKQFLFRFHWKWNQLECEVSSDPYPRDIFSKKISYHTPRNQNEIENYSPSFLVTKESTGILRKIEDFHSRYLEIMVEVDKNNMLSSLSEEERKQFEMIWSTKSEQVERTLSFFTQRVDLFKEIKFFHVLDILLFEGDLLSQQLRTHPEYAETLSLFFHNALQYFDFKKHPEQALQLIRIGIMAKMECETLNPDLAAHFPDFSKILKDTDWPQTYEKDSTQKNTQEARTHLLILQYHLKDPAKVSSQEVEKAIKDLCWNGFRAANHLAQLSAQVNETLPKWEYYVADLLNKNKLLRDEILTGVVVNRKEYSKDEPILSWEGSYPLFTSGRLSLILNCHESKPDLITNNTPYLNIIHSTLKAISDKEIKGTIINGKFRTSFSYDNPEQVIGAEIISTTGEKDKVIFYKIIAGEIYTLIKGMESSNDAPLTTYWMSQPDQQGMTKVFKFIANNKSDLIQVHTDVIGDLRNDTHFTIPLSSRVHEDKIWNEASLEKQQHGLQLLSWFQPLSKIKCFHDPNAASHIQRIEFTELDLVFNVERIHNKWEAVSDGKIPGFFISRKQKLDSLSQYSRYLLLENSQEEKKVILTVDSLSSALFSGISKNANFFTPSQAMGSLLSTLFQNSNKLNFISQQYFVYEIDSKGQLTSSDPEALIHLLCYHAASGNINELLHYLDIFEGLARQTALSEKTKAMIDYFKLGALALNNEELTRIALRLTAACGENTLLHSESDKNNQEKQKPTSEKKQLLGLVADLINFSRFDERRDKLPHLPINEYQELFILNYIVNTSQRLCKELSPKPPAFISKIIDKVGEDILPTVLEGMPKLSKRYDFLRRTYEFEGEAGVSNVKSFFKNFFFNKDGKISEGSSGNQVKPTHSLLDVITEWYNSVPSQKTTTYKNIFSKLSNQIVLLVEPKLIPTSFSEVSTQHLFKYFYFYYQLARKEIPNEIADDEIARNEFALKAQTFERTLSFMKGDTTDPDHNSLVNLLSIVCKNADKAPPSSDILELFEQIKYIEEVQKDEVWGLANAEEHLKKQEELNDKKNRLIHLYGSYYDSFVIAHSPLKSPILNSLLLDNFTSLLKSGGKNYLAKKFGVSPFYTLFQMAKTANATIHAALDVCIEKAEARREKAQLEVQKEIQDKPIDECLQKILEEEDEGFSATLERFFHDNFEMDKSVPNKRTNPIKKFRSPINQKLYRKSFRKMQRSLQDFYNRPKTNNETWRCKSYENLFILEKQLSTTNQVLNQHLAAEKKVILKFLHRLKRDDRDEEAIIKGAAKIQSSGCRGLSPKEEFKLLLKLFLHGDHEAILSMGTLSKNEIPQLESLLYRYLCKSTRKQQIRRCLGLVKSLQKTPGNQKREMQIRLEQLAFELRRRRSYKFDCKSSRLLKGYLILEYKTKKMLWDKQVNQLNRMLLGSNSKVVLEQIVGSGKTFLMPLTDYFAANGKQMVINVWPSALAKTNIAQNSVQGRKNFGQDSIVFRMTRKLKLGAENLWCYLRRFQRAIDKKEQINTTKEDLQALELRFIEAVHNRLKNNENAPSNEILFDYANLLKMIRVSGKGNIDEAHQAFRRNDELNYPLGKKKHVKKSCIGAIQECIHLLNKHVNLKDNQQRFLKTETTYMIEILPKIAKDLTKYKRFELIEEQQEEFAQYISGKLDYIPEFVQKHPMKEEMALMKGMITKILPKTCLENRVVNVDFGPSKQGNGEYARPYAGNENPVETATIQNPFEAVAKTYIMFLHRRLTNVQGMKFLLALNKLADSQAKRMKTFKENTPISILFKKWCVNAGFENYTLDDFSESKIFKGSGEKLANTLKLLSENDDAVMGYVRLLVAPKIEYFDLNLKSDSINSGSMFDSYYSCTGTPNKDGVFPQGNKVLWDKGTGGETIDLLCKMCDTPDSLLEIDAETPKDSIEKVIEIIDQNRKMSAVIDQGAAFYGFRNEAVAERLLRYIDTSREDMDGIVFYDSDKNLVIWEKGSKKPIPLTESNIPPEKRLTYYDNNHTFGADIDQPFGSEGFVIIGEDVDMLEYTQAVGRMRGLKTKGQRVRIGMLKRVSEMIAGADKKPNIRQTIAFARTNEARATAEDNYLSDCQKIADVIRRAVLDKMIHAESIGMLLSIASEFYSVLVSERKQDPFVIYGQPEESVSPLEALKKLKANQFEIIKKSFHFTDDEKKEIQKKLDAIKQEIYPEKVEIQKVNGKLRVGSHIDLGMAQQVEQDQTQENDQDIDRDNDMQQEQDQQRSNQLAMESRESSPHFRKHGATWDDTIDYFSSKAWLKPSDPKSYQSNDRSTLFRLSDLMKTSSREEIFQAADAFHGRLFCSNNFVGILNNGTRASFCGPRQKPVREILVVERTDDNGDKHIHTCALDDEDVTFWRKKFVEDRRKQRDANPKIRIALFDIHSEGTLDTGRNRLMNQHLKNNQVFNRHVAMWKVFNGNTHYSESQLNLLDRWTERHGKEIIKEAFEYIHKIRPLQPIEGSNIESLFLNPLDILVS